MRPAKLGDEVTVTVYNEDGSSQTTTGIVTGFAGSWVYIGRARQYVVPDPLDFPNMNIKWETHSPTPDEEEKV